MIRQIKTKKKMVDVIIPVFNSGDYLIDALTSCKNQTYKSLKVYVIDDNSTEDIFKIIKDFKNDLDIYYIRNSENLGPSASRNVGIVAGESEYISFLDADDVWDEKKIELTIARFSQEKDIGMVCGNYRRWEDRKHLRAPFYKKEISLNFQALKKVNYVACGSVTVKRLVLDDIGLFNVNYKIAEDYDLWIRISKKYNISYIHYPLYNYSCIKTGASLTNRGDLMKHGTDVLRKIKMEHYGNCS